MERRVVRGWRIEALVMIAGLIASGVLMGMAVAQTPSESGRASVGTPEGAATRAWDGGWKAGFSEEPARDTVSGEVMVVAAYMALWVILFLYVVRLTMGLKALKRDAEDLRRRLDEGRGP